MRLSEYLKTFTTDLRPATIVNVDENTAVVTWPDGQSVVFRREDEKWKIARTEDNHEVRLRANGKRRRKLGRRHDD